LKSYGFYVCKLRSFNLITQSIINNYLTFGERKFIDFGNLKDWPLKYINYIEIDNILYLEYVFPLRKIFWLIFKHILQLNNNL